MPENTIPTTDPAATPAAEPPTAAAPTTTEPPAEPDWKVEARKWESRAKENKAALDAAAPKLSEYDKLVQASKTDAQRLEDDAATARKEAADAKSEAARLRVAVKHKIAEEDFDLLGDGTEEELTARAERIVALRGAAAQPTVPKPNPAQGSSASGAPDLETQIAAAKAAGDVNLQIRLQNQKLLAPLKP